MRTRPSWRRRARSPTQGASKIRASETGAPRCEPVMKSRAASARRRRADVIRTRLPGQEAEQHSVDDVVVFPCSC
jgi:hypothetical protein